MYATYTRPATMLPVSKYSISQFQLDRRVQSFQMHYCLEQAIIYQKWIAYLITNLQDLHFSLHTHATLSTPLSIL